MSGAGDWTSIEDQGARRDFFAAGVAAELPWLMRLARRLAGEEQEAEGAVQDTLERAWRARGQLRDEQALGAWLRSILARVVVDRRRRRRDLPAGPPDAFESLLPDVDEPDALIEAAQDESAMRAALRRLSVDDRVAMVLHDGAGWQASEVAELLGASTEATHKRIQRARSRLVSVLAEETTVGTRPPSGDCLEARVHAHALLDGTLSNADRAAVGEHLASCPFCPASVQAAAGAIELLARRTDSEQIPDTIREHLDQLVRTAAASS